MHPLNIEIEAYGTVLLIHDYSPRQMELLRAHFRLLECNLLTALNGSHALGMAAAASPDLIVVNVSMPDMDAIEFCRLFRSSPMLSGIPVLLLAESLREDNETVRAGIDAGVDDYLAIPYDPVDLIKKVVRLIERHRAAKTWELRERYFQRLIESSPDNITVLSQDGNTLYESPSVEQLTGYNPEELLGRNNFASIHRDDLQLVLDAFMAGLLGEENGPPVKYRYRHKNGSWRLLESVGRRFIDQSGNAAAIINTRDVTHRRLTDFSEQLRCPSQHSHQHSL